MGYFLLNGLLTSLKTELVIKYHEFIHLTRIIVTLLPIDGTFVNMTMAEKLDADFSNSCDLKMCYKHPVTNLDGIIFLDVVP